MKAKILRAAWFTPGIKGRWGLPLLFEGKPGTAKTDTIERSARHFGLPVETVIASIREPSDFLGVGIPEKGVLHYSTPAWARRLIDAGRGVAYFDEFNTAPPATRAALLRVTLEGMVGDTWLPSTIRFVAAQNAVEDAESGFDLSAPTANRWGHLPWPAPTAEEWAAWVLGGTAEEQADPLNAAAEEARVEAAWGVPFARAKGLVAGFVKRRPELLHKQPKQGDPQVSKAWPSPRSWDMAMRALAGAQLHGLDASETDMLVGAFIGDAAMLEFASWQSQIDLPDPVKLLDGEIEFNHDPARLDRTVAVFDACAALVSPATVDKRTPRASKLWVMMAKLMDTSPDLVVSAARQLVSAKLHKVKGASDVLNRMANVLATAKVDSE